MVLGTKVKFYSSKNTNAPQIARTYGTLIDILDACLISGFGTQSVLSLTASGKTVTVNFGSNHNYIQYQVVKISGADQDEFNGEHRITKLTPNSIDFELASNATVTSATGSITCVLPPLNFEKPFSSSSSLGKRAAYRSKNLSLASRPFLRVLDERTTAYNAQFALYAKVGIVEEMTGIDTMSGVQAPYLASASTRNWTSTGSGDAIKYGWAKWYYAILDDAYADSNKFSDYDSSSFVTPEWFLVGDGDVFYFLPNPSFQESGAIKGKSLCYGFGAFKTIGDGDVSNNFLAATLRFESANGISYRTNETKGLNSQISYGTLDEFNICIQRAAGNSTKFTQAAMLSMQAKDYPFSGQSDSNLIKPTTNNFAGIVLVTPSIIEASAYTNILHRGLPKIIKHIAHATPFNDLDVFGINQQIYICKNTLATGGGSNFGQVVFSLNDEDI